MEAEGSLRLSQVPATCPYPEPARYANERLYFIAAKSDIFVEKKTHKQGDVRKISVANRGLY